MSDIPELNKKMMLSTTMIDGVTYYKGEHVMNLVHALINKVCGYEEESVNQEHDEIDSFNAGEES